MIKRITVLILLLAVVLLSFPVQAEKPPLSPLTNRTIVDVLNHHGYENWDIFQPDSREESDMDTASDSFLDLLSQYPVIAIQGNEVNLIILQKVNEQWTISTVNEKALSRPDFTLTGFSIQEQINDSEIKVYTYFTYMDERGENIELCLDLYNIYPSCFSAIHMPDKTILLQEDLGLSFQIEYPFLFKCSYEIITEQYMPFGVEEFSFADCPLSMQDLLTPVTLSPDDGVAELFLIPDHSMEPVIRLSAGDKVDLVRQKLITEWALVYYCGNYFYIQTDDITLN